MVNLPLADGLNDLSTFSFGTFSTNLAAIYIYEVCQLVIDIVNDTSSNRKWKIQDGGHYTGTTFKLYYFVDLLLMHQWG